MWYKATLTSQNYTAPNPESVTVTIAKATPIKTEPTAKASLTANNSNQVLINAGAIAANAPYELLYAIGTSAPADGSSAWKTTATDITGNASGTYTVWYKARLKSSATDNNYQIAAAKSITVTIGAGSSSSGSPSSGGGSACSHTWGAWTVTKAATCVAQGEKQCACSKCQSVQSVKTGIDPNNHVNTEVRDAKEATETEEGYTGDTWCKDCSNKIADGTVIPMKTTDVPTNTGVPEPTPEPKPDAKKKSQKLNLSLKDKGKNIVSSKLKKKAQKTAIIVSAPESLLNSVMVSSFCASPTACASVA